MWQFFSVRRSSYLPAACERRGISEPESLQIFALVSVPRVRLLLSQCNRRLSICLGRRISVLRSPPSPTCRPRCLRSDMDPLPDATTFVNNLLHKLAVEKLRYNDVLESARNAVSEVWCPSPLVLLMVDSTSPAWYIGSYVRSEEVRLVLSTLQKSLVANRFVLWILNITSPDAWRSC
jgi:hypothetical protein